MIRNENLTVVIPVRGGSKGIPRKNLYRLGKDTLLERAIKIALQCDYIDKVFVSTEDKEMFDIACKYGVNTSRPRPKSLSTDYASTIDVLNDLITSYSLNSGWLLLLQVTSATRKLEDLNKFCKQFNEASDQFDSSVSLVSFDSPHPDKIQQIKNGRVESYLGKNSMVSRQSLPEVYELNGSFYLAKVQQIRDKKSFFTSNTLPFVMDINSSINLDNPSDLLYLELLVTKGILKIEEY